MSHRLRGLVLRHLPSKCRRQRDRSVLFHRERSLAHPDASFWTDINGTLDARLGPGLEKGAAVSGWRFPAPVRKVWHAQKFSVPAVAAAATRRPLRRAGLIASFLLFLFTLVPVSITVMLSPRPRCRARPALIACRQTSISNSKAT